MDVEFAPAADRQLSQLRVYDQRRIADGIRKNLVEADPRVETRKKFALQPAAEFADYELRVGEFRIFYRIEPTETGERVLVAVIGQGSREANCRRRGAENMKTVSLTDAKNHLPRLVNGLVEGPIVLTRNGKPCAALVGLDEKLDREAFALGRNKRLRKLINDACREAQEKGTIPFTKVLAKVHGRTKRRENRFANS